MSQLLSRLLLALILLLASPVVYILTYIIVEEILLHQDDEALLAANAVTGLLVALCWILIWRPQVRWTTPRAAATLVAAVLCVVPASVAGSAILLVNRNFEEVAQVVGGMTWMTAWLASTVIIWRESRVERAARLGRLSDQAVTCPVCSYNLTGLKEARCPECGSEFTLEELVSAITLQREDLETVSASVDQTEAAL